MNGATLTFEQYNILLQSAATQYESTSKSVQQKRSVYQNDITNNDDLYNIDITVDTIHANMTNSRPSYPSAHCLPNDRWKLLSQEERAAWNSLTKDIKSAILGLNQTKPNPNQRQSFVHDVNRDEIDSPSDNYNDNVASSTDILVNSASSNGDISTADIRKSCQQ